MGARTYRTFKQILRASKTRKAWKGKTQTKKKTRRVKRRPFAGGEAAGAAQKKQKGGNRDLLSYGSTVVGKPLGSDEEDPNSSYSPGAWKTAVEGE